MTSEQIQTLRSEIESLCELVKEKAVALDKAERDCSHTWNDIQFTPYQWWYEDKDHCPEGQNITKKRWTRVCKNCGVKQMSDLEPKNGQWTHHAGFVQGCSGDMCNTYFEKNGVIVLNYKRVLPELTVTYHCHPEASYHPEWPATNTD